MRKSLLFGMIVLLAHATLFAQQLNDTIYIEEVTLYSDYRKFQPGSKFQKISFAETDLTQESGLDQLIGRYTPVYIKANAAGLSTIRIRGTSPDHTAINFGGININSITLGHSNVAAIPTFLFDNLELQYGSASTLNGSGALGGALYLGINKRWTEGMKLELKTIGGSFGEEFYGSKVFLGNGKFESVTRLYSYGKANNFPFLNKYTGNVENRDPVKDIQQGAAVKHAGILQEFNYLFTPDEYLVSMIWYEDFWYQIQPNMQSNYHFTGTEAMQNNNLRFWSEYKNENKAMKWQLGTGYSHDYQLYNNIESQKIITDQWLAEAAVKHHFNKKTEFKTGAKYQYIVPDVYSYPDSSITSEHHLDLYFSLFYQPVSRLKSTLNLRQLLVSNFKAPFTPSVAAEYLIIDNGSDKLSAIANLARSYRIPTLNDRFWVSQGNPDLRPEKGFHFESGIQLEHEGKVSTSVVKLHAYYMDINDWIEWRNFGVWQAQNVMRVISQGIEFHLENHRSFGPVKAVVFLNYQLNSAEKIEPDRYGNTTREQLIYTPVHMGNVVIQSHYKKITLAVDASYTGSRKANYLGAILKPYVLTNASVNYHFGIGRHQCKASLAATNLMNVQYENEKYYAMPGIGFRAGFSMMIQPFNKNKKAL
jgi:vitamin B12 transporter